jgi:predicted CXXCH cytochrome family protein
MRKLATLALLAAAAMTLAAGGWAAAEEVAAQPAAGEPATAGPAPVATAEPVVTAEPTAPTCALLAADRANTASSFCLGCHAAHDHPVGAVYEDVMVRFPEGYRPSREVPPAVPLVAGLTACTSCHDGASAIAYKLALEADRPLCIACHLK